MPRCFVGLLGFASVLALLPGCTTIASRIAVAPPDINKVSFRECLLDRGFYSYDPLTGVALRDWHYRHDPTLAGRRHSGSTKAGDRLAWLEQSDGRFVATAAERIADGVMPAQEYWDRRTSDRTTASGGEAEAVDGAAPHYDDRGLNHPYVAQGAPQRYPIPVDRSGAAPAIAAATPSVAYGEGVNWRLNRFLDCYVAPVGVADAGPVADAMAPAGLREYGDEDIEGRLLRGHILLALLTQYGTELIVTHPSRRQVAQAELLLGHVKDAEISLRRSSVVMDEERRTKAAAVPGLLTAADEAGNAINLAPGAAPPAAPAAGKPAAIRTLTIADLRGQVQEELGWTEYTTRVLRIFQVGVDIQRIDAEQTLDRFSNLIAAFSGPAGGFKSVLKDGLAGIVTVQKVRLYGGAYLRDARGTLAVGRATTRRAGGSWTYDVQALSHGWKLWDREIARACQVLATIGKKDPASAVCIPGEPEAKAAT